MNERTQEGKKYFHGSPEAIEDKSKKDFISVRFNTPQELELVARLRKYANTRKDLAGPGKPQ